MKNSSQWFVALAAVIALAFPACQGREDAAGAGVDGTATIAPAEPQPAPTGTEAMTQTVDIEAGRTDAEGGVLTDPNPNAPAGTAGTTGTLAPPPTQTTTR